MRDKTKVEECCRTSVDDTALKVAGIARHGFVQRARNFGSANVLDDLGATSVSRKEERADLTTDHYLLIIINYCYFPIFSFKHY